MKSIESPEKIDAVEESLASAGLKQGNRRTRVGRARRDAPKSAALATETVRPGVVRAVGWERYPWLHHGFSSRVGGVSAIYGLDASGAGSLNLGWTKEDSEDSVAENRRRFVAEVGGACHLVTVRQFHSGMARTVERGDGTEQGRLQTPDGRAVLRGDGLMTDVPGVVLGVQTADCVPVIVVDVRRRAVAAFHAGWRGTLARIVERGVGAMRLRYGSRPHDLVAAVGPAIGPCCYSVGEEVRSEFESQFAYAPELFSEVYDSDPAREKYPLLFMTARAPGHSNLGPQIHLNLWEANRRQLLDAGIPAKRVTVVGECTACALVDGHKKYFSHRAESGFAGRMIAAVGVAG
jgi:polyphenol oxidase